MKRTTGKTLAVAMIAAAMAATAEQPYATKPYKVKTEPIGGSPEPPEKLPKGVKRYNFDAYGNECEPNNELAAYSCVARNLSNAKRKFDNEFKSKLFNKH